MVENIDIQIMLSPIIALILAVIIVILEVVLSSRKSRMAGLWPAVIMTALIGICLKGYSFRRDEMKKLKIEMEM